MKLFRVCAVTRVRFAAILPSCAIAFSPVVPASANDAISSDQQLQAIVVQATAIPGSTIDVDKFPGNVQTLRASDLSRDGSASLIGALNSQLGSVNINDDLDDPFQPDILYRGFEASPVLGTPQGLAVYQNGVRINEAFGDTVNWDLFPDIAIDRLDIVSSSPVYGLNALGGAISLSMKNGFTYQGTDLELSGGSFGQRSVAGQVGMKSEHWGFYIAGNALDWNDTWRLFSNDALRTLYSALSARTDRASFDLTYTRADNRMNGQGSAPVQELGVNRSLVFTGPQSYINSLDFATLNTNLKVTDTWSLQSLLYYRQFGQSIANGNTTNYTSCTNIPGSLCQPDGTTPVMNAAGAVLPDISEGGAIPIGENDFELVHSYGRGAALQTTDSQSILGHNNQFTAGATVDYANSNFYSGAQIGVINPYLLVLPSNLIVDTPENSPAGMEFGAVPVSLKAINKNYGFFATDTFDVNSAFSVTASGRYNIADIDLEDKLGTNLTGSNRYTHLNPAIGAAYKVLPTLTVYAGISENTRTPTASEIECSNPLQPCLLPTNLAGDPPTLRQVIAHTTEFGVRGKIPDAFAVGSEVTWNLSAFRTRLHDDIYGIATSVSQGFFENIGDTRRQGVEAGFGYTAKKWSAYANYSYVDATFESSLTVASPSNPYQDANGDIHVVPGDRLPGIPQNRLKIGADYKILPNWSAGATLNWVSSFFFVGDQSNQLAQISGYRVVGLHSSYQASKNVQIFASIHNLFNTKYATWGILGDPTGVGAPGVPPNGVTNGPGVDNRFLSPAPPFEAFGGVRITF
jgi:iron complex outermembrane receptor protein